MKTYVYFLRCAARGRIKIGTTRRLRARVQSLQTSSADDLIFMGAIPGGVELERELHARFSADRDRLEWFRETSGLRSFIADQVALQGIDTLPGWQSSPSDTYTDEAAGWASRLVAVRMQREGCSLPMTRKSLQRDYGLVAGLFENLARKRIAAITTHSYFCIHQALVDELQTQLTEMRADVTQLRSINADRPSLPAEGHLQ